MRLKNIKDKLYYYFAEKNWGVRREYGPYVDIHKEEHQAKRWKHWWLLIRLNWHYRIIRSKEFLIKPQRANKQKRNPPESFGSMFNKESKQNRYRFILETWNTAGATKELIFLLKLWEQGRWSWKKNNPDVFLIYICCLLETGEKEEAKRVLKKYVSNFGKRNIERYMPVAHLFIEMGYEDFTIEKSAFVFNQLEENRKSKILESLLKGKRIAVVGNGGSELGKHRGKEIDGHDIVIRFNNYPDGYSDDYGRKIDIWVRNGNVHTEDRDIIENVSLILWEPDYWHLYIQYDHLDLLYRDIRLGKYKVNYMYGVRRELYKHSDILNPTSGAQMIYWLETHKNLFQEVNYYGFSFLDSNSDLSYQHYYGEISEAKKHHQPQIEIDFLRDLVIKNKISFNTNSENKQELSVGKSNRYTIYACAFREYNVSSGKTGGPAGVLAMQKELLGEVYNEIPIKYLFLSNKIKYPKHLTEYVKCLPEKMKSIFQGAYFIQTNSDIKNDLNNNITPVLICHELGTAYGAFLMGLKYILVYHQQGSILNEMKATGVIPSEYHIQIMNKIEKRILENAHKVYFPSMGAKQILIDTSDIVSKSKNISFADFPLYNTIPEINENSIDISCIKKLGIPELDRKNTEIFFSCGDYNFDKGMDRIPNFLNEYANLCKKKVFWIAIGSAGTGGFFEKLNEEKCKWKFDCVLIGERTDHDTLLALMEYSDYYLMLHRNSIFDLAILEAMRSGTPLILSPVGGNLEFNVCNNVVFVQEKNNFTAIQEIRNRDYNSWKQSNIKAFNDYFSHEKFTQNYLRAISDLLGEN